MKTGDLRRFRGSGGCSGARQAKRALRRKGQAEPALLGSRSGAAGYVAKKSGDLADAVRRVHRSDISLPSEITRRLLELEPQPAVETPGWSNQRVADNFHLAEATIRTHLKRIFEKLELANRVELALYAVQVGLIDLGRGQEP